MEELDKVASSSDRHPAVTKGQEDLAGVKSVQIKRNFKKNSEEEYVVTQSTRTEMIYESAEQARDAYLNIHDAKEEAEFEDTEKNMDKIDDHKDETQEEVQTPEVGSMTEEEEKSAFDARRKADFDANLIVQAAASAEIVNKYVPGAQDVQPLQNPGQVSSGTGAQNKPGLESYTKNNGYGVMPEHINTNKPFAYDQKEAAAEPRSLIQPDFKVSPMENELKMGVNREHEHTSDPAVATEIALDHLAEDKDYYTKLNQVMPESGKEEKKERVVYVNPHDKAVEDFDYEAVGKEVMFPGTK